VSAGEPLWSPSLERRQRSHVQELIDAHGFGDYQELWEWSVDESTKGAFWANVAQAAGIEWHHEPTSSVEPDDGAVPGVSWFPEGTLNYAELALRGRDADAEAIFAFSDTRGSSSMTWAQLGDLVARLRHGLLREGVGRGDVVAAYLPNIPETTALMLACASLGAVWTCCAPEMKAAGVLDRFLQAAPKIFVSIDGYRYGEKRIDVRAEAEEIRRGLASVRASFMLRYLGEGESSWRDWSALVDEWAPLDYVPVPFAHPLYVLYSSGTTGKPKAIVHGHGGIMLEHVKALRYHFDLDAQDRFFWYTTTGWMMWNFLTSGLLVGAAIGLYDGDPNFTSPLRLWAFIDEQRVTCAGLGASFLVANLKAGLRPGEHFAFGHLETLGATGSPLPRDAAAWVYREVKPDLLLESFSGGTDVCSGFVGASPVHDVWGGEISCRCLGTKVEVFDDAGASLVDREGELVITSPMPSMPVAFLNDPGGRRYHQAYFERFEGVWAHGDRATLTSRGTLVITGRSDGTLNRGGVRMGTAEFYVVVEALEEVADSLVVHVEDPGGGPGRLWLFVVARPGTGAGALRDLARGAIKAKLSPRHVPDEIVVVEAVPRTLSGKKMEVPIKQILSGADPAAVVTLSSMANPESLGTFIELAATPRV